MHAWSQKLHVVLADEMGLGKTIQAIAFLSALMYAPSDHAQGDVTSLGAACSALACCVLLAVAVPCMALTHPPWQGRRAQRSGEHGAGWKSEACS